MDPGGHNGGDTSLYAYVGNEPINLIDPTGLYGHETHFERTRELASVAMVSRTDLYWGNCGKVFGTLMLTSIDRTGDRSCTLRWRLIRSENSEVGRGCKVQFHEF